MKKFFCSIAFRNVFGGNILQNGIAAKLALHMQKLMDVNFGVKGKSPYQQLQTKIEILLLRTRKIGVLRKLPKN